MLDRVMRARSMPDQYPTSHGCSKFKEPRLLRTVRATAPIDSWIDLADYSLAARNSIRESKYCGIYVIGAVEDGPSKIGISDGVWKRIGEVQNGNWVKLYVYRLFWVPKRDMAVRIEAELHKRFSENRLTGEWFALAASRAASLVVDVCNEIYPERWIKTHQQMICLMADRGKVG